MRKLRKTTPWNSSPGQAFHRLLTPIALAFMQPEFSKLCSPNHHQPAVLGRSPMRISYCILISTISFQAWAQDAPRPLTKYANVKLTADLSKLSDDQRRMIPLLIDAADQMDDCFWYQAYGSREDFFASLPPDDSKDVADAMHMHGLINYGPWERLQGNRPFVGNLAKPLGANFYPKDMSKEEFDAAAATNPDLKSLYSFVRRTPQGRLRSVPYNVVFAKQFGVAAAKLKAAANLADDDGFRAYLNARAEALLSNSYQPSDMLWMEMKTNKLDIVIGPIETYEDQLYGYKAACEAYVLVKDTRWSDRLSRYAAMLPDLQKQLPVDEKYKQEVPGSNSDLNAYDVVYYAGDCNSGSKTIAINLPNDEEVQLAKGSRRLQLKNAMRAKFDQILVPIADLLIAPEQRKHITFNAFFSNTMFHEVAHGLGIKETITGKGRVREALRETSSAIEEGKADILGLYMVTQLIEDGTLTDGSIDDYYVTFMASVFRSVRFGATSAHGKANMLRFNFFKDRAAFTRNDQGHYRVDIEKMKVAMQELTGELLKLQGDGDYGAARDFTDRLGFVGTTLAADLERVNQKGIPTDIVFDQGVDTLGLVP